MTLMQFLLLLRLLYAINLFHLFLQLIVIILLFMYILSIVYLYCSIYTTTLPNYHYIINYTYIDE